MKKIDKANVQNKDTSGKLCTANSVSITKYASDIERFVGQYQQFAVKTAQSTLEMCRVVFEAKRELKKDDFVQFCSNIAHKPEDSTIRKYLAIGEKYEEFINCAQLLPNSWTSIYLITQIPADMFNVLVATNSDMSNLTGKEIQKLIDSSKNVESDNSKEDSHSAQTEERVEAIGAADTDGSCVSRNDVLSELTPAVNIHGDFFHTTNSKNNTEANEQVSAEDIFPHGFDTAADASTSALDGEYAKKATHDLINQVSVSIINESSDDEKSPYEVTIRFDSAPPDDAISEILKALFEIKDKYKLKFEIDANVIEHV